MNCENARKREGDDREVQAREKERKTNEVSLMRNKDQNTKRK